MIALISLAFNVLVAAVGLTWGVGKIRDAVRDEIEDYEDKNDERIDTLRVNVGEMGAALRTKISEVELFTRDTFVRRDSFNKILDSFAAMLRSEVTRLDSRLNRMENKIDVAMGHPSSNRSGE
jgi:hypothetical protein